MAAYEMEGTVKKIEEMKTFDSGFTKREFVLATEADRFPQEIKFECVKDRTALLDNISEGQNVKVTFDILGREYNGRHFVNLNAWKIQPPDTAKAAPPDDLPPFEEPDGIEEELDPPF